MPIWIIQKNCLIYNHNQKLPYRHNNYPTTQLIQMLKQNIIPTRQGELYKVNLSSNYSDGPFLKKDIMHNNKRSLALLTGQGVLQTLTHFNNSTAMLQTKTREISSLYPENVDNITNIYHKCEGQLQILSADSARLMKQQQTLKLELQQIYEKQKQQQHELYHQCMPLLKVFFKTVKDSKNRQKDQYHLMERMLVEIEETKKVLVEGMLECEKKIVKLEQAIGYQTGDADVENDLEV